ncbi:hypothetical protein BDK51DRAFT_42754 [Blyttiomyces helicus]|uniref:F-box domain-containing protein n=1 Tax=Blyttiomyces helicus TaxID=388810 RepID=A0A4P9WFT1_9FUNG|nr:hypothetical protein BDK51DRAFT_42754 [Blyttiomyces helicus]|eukprot:RKO91629.1 hypothetical protein BDK51DRAFT_42754 [Blyttiomyces helicus]
MDGSRAGRLRNAGGKERAAIVLVLHTERIMWFHLPGEFMAFISLLEELFAFDAGSHFDTVPSVAVLGTLIAHCPRLEALSTPSFRLQPSMTADGEDPTLIYGLFRDALMTVIARLSVSLTELTVENVDGYTDGSESASAAILAKLAATRPPLRRVTLCDGSRLGTRFIYVEPMQTDFNFLRACSIIEHLDLRFVGITDTLLKKRSDVRRSLTARMRPWAKPQCIAAKAPNLEILGLGSCSQIFDASMALTLDRVAFIAELKEATRICIRSLLNRRGRLGRVCRDMSVRSGSPLALSASLLRIWGWPFAILSRSLRKFLVRFV